MCEGCVRGTCACVSLCVMCLFESLKNARDERVRNCERMSKKMEVREMRTKAKGEREREEGRDS